LKLTSKHLCREKVVQKKALTTESSTARWSIPGKSINFNGGAGIKQLSVMRRFYKAPQKNIQQTKSFSTE
jgi:hypothetical protein